MKTLIYLLTITLFSIQLNERHEINVQDDWKLAKNEGGVVVYTRQPKGKKIKEFKAIVKIKTSMEKPVQLLENIEGYKNWQSNISDSYTIKKISSTERYIYSALDVPWPISDRDVVTHLKKTVYESGKVVFTFNSSPDYIKPKEGFVRIREAKGTWTLTRVEDGYIKVVYQSYGDPAGSIPSFIINAFIVEGPHETLLNMANKCK